MAARFYDLLTDISHRGQYNHATAHACMAAIGHSSCLHRMPLGKTLAMASFSHVGLPFCVWAYRDCIPETFPVSTELRSLQLATLWRMNKMLEPCCAHVAGDPFVAGCRKFEGQSASDAAGRTRLINMRLLFFVSDGEQLVCARSLL